MYSSVRYSVLLRTKLVKELVCSESSVLCAKLKQVYGFVEKCLLRTELNQTPLAIQEKTLTPSLRGLGSSGVCCLLSPFSVVVLFRVGPLHLWSNSLIFVESILHGPGERCDTVCRYEDVLKLHNPESI